VTVACSPEEPTTSCLVIRYMYRFTRQNLPEAEARVPPQLAARV
jgi:hypothetical protein